MHMRLFSAANSTSQLSHMLHYHHHHRHLNRIRITCFCLNRDGATAGRGSPSHDQWSRDHAHLCDVQRPPLAAADSASHISDQDIARHMNSLQPHVIIDLHGFMCDAAFVPCFCCRCFAVCFPFCLCRQSWLRPLSDIVCPSICLSYSTVFAHLLTLLRFLQAW
jgi:hypothetical protein